MSMATINILPNIKLALNHIYTDGQFLIENVVYCIFYETFALICI